MWRHSDLLAVLRVEVLQELHVEPHLVLSFHHSLRVCAHTSLLNMVPFFFLFYLFLQPYAKALITLLPYLKRPFVLSIDTRHMLFRIGCLTVVVNLPLEFPMHDCLRGYSLHLGQLGDWSGV